MQMRTRTVVALAVAAWLSAEQAMTRRLDA
jgi:hypothetical protein